MLPLTAWVGVPKLTLAAGARNPRYATAPNAVFETQICCFASGSGCLGLIMKNPVKYVYF